MATLNKSRMRSHVRANSASSVPSAELPQVHSSIKRTSRPSSLSITGKNALVSSLNSKKSVDFATAVEHEYIRNLQQQVYFLELECEHLQDQVKKASLKNSIALEAEKLTRKLKVMQTELQQKEQDVLQKDAVIHILQSDKEKVLLKLQQSEETFSEEKKELINEVVCLKKQIERQELNGARKDTDIEKTQREFDKTLLSLKEADNKTNILQAEANEKSEAFNRIRVELEESRADYLKLQTEFKELEERFFNSKAKPMEGVDLSLKGELKNLRYELREKELQADHERTLRLKISDDCAALVKENAALSSQVIELTKHLDMERDFKHDRSIRKQTTIQELVAVKEERKYLERELQRTCESLDIEREKYRQLLDKYTSEEENHTRAKLQRSKLKAELEELQGLESVESKENVQLRRDNMLMSDEVTDLQAQLREREDELHQMKIKFSDLQISHADLDSKHRLQSNLDSIKWEEFERMAEQMKQFSRTMSPSVRNSNTSLIQSRIVEEDT